MELYPQPYEKSTEAQRDYIISLVKEKLSLKGNNTWKEILNTLNNHFKDNLSSIEYLDKKKASRWIKDLQDLPS